MPSKAMRPDAEAIVARARSLVGTRFRPQGRSAADGLDCIGLVALAIDARIVPGDYALRGGSAVRLARELRAAGLRPVEAMETGDVLVLLPGPGQLHLGIFTSSSLLHGDAGLRRVVERPLPLPWPLAGIWRL
jgi:murein DD-endopeptidase / murein LD-carboxypeptidase